MCSYTHEMANLTAALEAVTAASERTLPVGELLAAVLPGLQRGTTLACGGDAPVGLALAAVAEASRAGAWVGVAGQPSLGLQAAAQAGVALSRLVAVHAGVPGGSGDGHDGHGGHDGRWGDGRWGEVLAAMIDGFDIVLVGMATARLRPGTGRRLQARAQARGAVLVTIGQHASLAADVRLDASVVRWAGLGDGHGLAHSRLVDVVAHGRRRPRPSRSTLVYPSVALPYLAPPPCLPSATVAPAVAQRSA